MKLIKWKDLKIGFKYGVVLLITIVLFISATVYVTSLLANIKDSIGAIEHKGERSITITQMAYLLKSKDAVISDYIFFPSKRALEEYESYEKEFIELQRKIEPEMNTKDLKLLFNVVTQNNKKINEIFKKNIIPQLNKNDKEKAMLTGITVSSISNSSFELFDKLRNIVNDDRQKGIDDAYEAVDKTASTLTISIVIAIVTGCIVIILVSRSINRNLSQIVNTVNKISKGDLKIEKIDYNGKDEIGELFIATSQMQNKLRKIIQEINMSSLEVSSQGKNLDQIAKEVKDGSDQIVATMQEMSSGVEEQTSSSYKIASSITGLIELIKQVNKNGIALENSSNDILDMACKGNEQMGISIEKMNGINSIFKEFVLRVKELEKNSENISELVQVINVIAKQTNLLALNAAIEAARAGEAGKGFAVVAEEIRKLAEQVENSINEITDIVVGIQNESRLMTESLEKGYYQVEEGTDQIKITGQAFKEINDEVVEMVDKIKDISQNIHYITENSESVNILSEQIAAVSEENSAGIEETVASVQQQNSSMEIIAQNADSLLSLSEKLSEVIGQFKW
ncbi:methyl-accepting chemotaxis protein [Wukongibacter baidiensis]|uniref:methyl-accepting chemotaxis protein n=1 Tax=Wukongibacter baidiensis TaxID=1723361 RepID=UPI003D7F3972